MFDSLLHHPVRTKLISLLSAYEHLAYRELKDHTGLTDGNLAGYLRSLEEAGYISYEKIFEGRKPKTIYTLTPSGKKAFLAYIDELKAFIRSSQ